MLSDIIPRYLVSLRIYQMFGRQVLSCEREGVLPDIEDVLVGVGDAEEDVVSGDSCASPAITL